MENEFIEVKDSGIHMKGVFAKKDIPKGTYVIEYVGEKISKDEALRRMDLSIEEHPGSCGEGAVYIFELNDEYDIDGDIEDNPAKFINHCCDPNCEQVIEDDRIFLVALKDIKPGEEITFNYGYGLEDDEGIEDLEDFKCKCGSPKCVGYMLDDAYWDKLKEVLSKEKDKPKVSSLSLDISPQ